MPRQLPHSLPRRPRLKPNGLPLPGANLRRGRRCPPRSNRQGHRRLAPLIPPPACPKPVHKPLSLRRCPHLPTRSRSMEDWAGWPQQGPPTQCVASEGSRVRTSELESLPFFSTLLLNPMSFFRDTFDRSLLLASVLLGGGCLLGAGVVYVVLSFADEVPLVRPHRHTVDPLGSPSHDWARQFRPSRRDPLRAPRPQTGRPSFLPRYDARTRTPPKTRQSPEVSPSIPMPDMSHAELGVSPSPGSPLTPGSRPANKKHGANAVFSRPIGSPSMGNAPSRSWRSELPTLNRRILTLSRIVKQSGSSPRSDAEKQIEEATIQDPLGPRARTASSPTPPSAPSQVPVNGGMGWLAAAGIVYALRRLHAARPA